MAAETQRQIRENAEELNNFVAEVSSWASEAKLRDEKASAPQQKQCQQQAYRTTDDSRNNVAITTNAPPIRSSPVSADQADQASRLRASGNQLFHQGKLQDAKQAYEASLQHHKTAAANANAALMCLKLGELSECIEYCTAALVLDASYMKAIRRRCAAYEGLGAVQEAAQDAELAVRLSPKTSQLKQEWKRLKKLLEDTLGICLAQPPHVLPIGEHARSAHAQKQDASSNKNLQQQARHAHERSQETEKHQTDGSVDSAAERAREKLHQARQTSTPVTAAELESALVELGDDTEKQANLIYRLKPTDIPRILAEGLSEHVLRYASRACLYHLDLPDLLPRLEALQAAPRFSVASLFVSKRGGNSDLQDALRAARERAHDADENSRHRLNQFARSLKLD